MRPPTPIRRRAVLLVAMATAGGLLARPALAVCSSSGAGRIEFYGDLGNIVGALNPLLVRPPTLYLAEDGSIALVNLRWTGWGTCIARAIGIWSESDCTPSCATGRRTTTPARVTLSDPGSVQGHRVYRCIQVRLSGHPRQGLHECLRAQDGFHLYVPVADRAAPPPGAFVPSWRTPD